MSADFKGIPAAEWAAMCAGATEIITAQREALDAILACVHNEESDRWHVAKGKGRQFNAAIQSARAVVARNESAPPTTEP